MVTLTESQLQFNDFQLVQEIYFPKNYEASSMWKLKQALWEKAVLQWEQTADSLGIGEVWEPLPIGKHFDSILDLGCGYGRLAAYLSKHKKITCNKYYGIDISESLLRRMLTYKRAYNLFTSAEFYLICMAGDKLPFEDNSIDFVRASSIFLNLEIEKEQLKHNLAEIARVIKPGGVFVFEELFYDRCCPAILDNVLNKTRKSKLNFAHLKQYSLREIKHLLKNSQLSQKCPQYTIKPHKPALLQEKFGNVGMPVSNDINKEINPPKFLKEFLACGYSVYSKV